MGQQHTISAVSEKTREYGDKIVYYVRLNEAEADVPSKAFELHKKKTSKPPAEGHRLDVKTFQKGDFQGSPFVKIIQDYKDAPAGGGGGGGDSKNFDRRPEHPRNESRMIHTSSLSATPGYIEQMLTIGVAEQPKTWDEYWALVEKVASKLTHSYEVAMEPQQQLPVAGGEVPADTDGLAPAAAAAPDDDKIPF